MESERYRIVRYTEEQCQVWDEFVMMESINGTFLQTRRFLNYHPPGRFMDVSLLIYDNKEHLAAVCPACELVEADTKLFYSHKGSTFGGIIIDCKNYTVVKVIAIIESIEAYLCEQCYDAIYYKITPDIFAEESSDTLQYGLYYMGYSEYKEINSAIFFDENYNDNILSHLKQGKRTNIHNCIKAGIQTRPLASDIEMEEFHDILKEGLQKYELQPVHTIEDLIDFKNKRLTNECEFFGAFLNDKMIAVSMMFYFNKSRCAHTQYLAAKREYDKLSPMSFMYYSMMLEMYRREYKVLSWGITTEHLGKKLNVGLTQSKEAFGSKHTMNRIYFKQLNGDKENGRWE